MSLNAEIGDIISNYVSIKHLDESTTQEMVSEIIKTVRTAQ